MKKLLGILVLGLLTSCGGSIGEHIGEGVYESDYDPPMGIKWLVEVRHITNSGNFKSESITNFGDAEESAYRKCMKVNPNTENKCLLHNIVTWFDNGERTNIWMWDQNLDRYARGNYPNNYIKSKKKVVAKKPVEKKTPEKVAKKPDPKKSSEKKITKTPEINTSLITIGSGSAFYINSQGYALSNNHVINICKQSVARVNGKEILFRVIATDKTNDVAILKTDMRNKDYIKINSDGAKLGENIVAVGYPLAGRLSDSVKITRGIVSSLSGINNNIGQIQIDAALQPGNSGGPVLNEDGEMVGIASAGLNKLLMAKEAKYIPENVNFAVASPIVVNILKNKKVKYYTKLFGGSYSTTELAELGNKATLQLLCRNTRSAYNRLKSDQRYTHVLLDLD